MLLFFVDGKGSGKEKDMELIGKVDFEALYGYGTKVVVAIGLLAFLVSVVVQVLKQIKWLEEHVPTQVTVMVVSLILCPVSMAAMASYYSVPIDWFMVFASFIAAFIVALVSMDGWERVTELASRMIRKK